jgi:hypothetical protein
MNWRIHSSNGRLTRAASVLSAYTTCIFDDPEHNGEGTDNQHIKSIVRTSVYESAPNPHKFITTNSTITVGEFGDEVTTIAFRKPITRDRISLHHYAVKSREEYEEKINRSNGMGDRKDWGFWDHIETMPHVECREMLRWAGKLS